MTKKRVLISGAGIAGSTLAYWLSRYGFDVTVVERAPRLPTGGNGVDVREQAIEVVERMGLFEQVRALATDAIGMAFIDAKGDVRTRIDMQALQRSANGRDVEILRGDLAKLLHDAAKDRGEYVFGDSVRAIEEDADGVMVALAGGGARRFDVVVGADGIHSSVRRMVFGSEDRFLRFDRHYFAVWEVDASYGEARWIRMYNEPGRMAGVWRAGNQSRAHANFVFHRREPLAYDHRDIEAQRAHLREAFAGAGWRTRELLEEAASDPEFFFDALCQVRMPAWSKGRVALVGDAAYCASPTSGAGAMLSLIGAYVLAGEMASAADDHVAAFRAYESAFRPEVAKRQKQLYTGMLVPKSRAAIWARNVLFRSPVIGALAGLQPRKATTLRTYEARAGALW